MRDVRSLKDKRNRLRRLSNQLVRSFGVAVAEVGYQDLWKRSTLGLALVASHAGRLERNIHTVLRWLDERPDIDVMETSTSYLEED